MSQKLPTKLPNADLAGVIRKTERFLSASKAKNTLRAYASDWNHFIAWCHGNGLSPAPASASTVAMYISDMAGDYAVSTIRRRLTAIRKAHRIADEKNPVDDEVVREVFDGIKREFGTAQKGKAPIITEDLVAMLNTTSSDTRGLRDRAILLVGYAGAFRRSELVGLDLDDIEMRPEGCVIRLRRSKTDQSGSGTLKAIPFGTREPTCPVKALSDWVKVAEIDSGPLFRPVTKSGSVRNRRLSSKSVVLIVKRCAEAAGMDPAKFAGHSLRSGLATQAAADGVSERSIMKQGSWKSVTMARRYIRDGSLFRDNAAGQVGL